MSISLTNLQKRLVRKLLSTFPDSVKYQWVQNYMVLNCIGFLLSCNNSSFLGFQFFCSQVISCHKQPSFTQVSQNAETSVEAATAGCVWCLKMKSEVLEDHWFRHSEDLWGISQEMKGSSNKRPAETSWDLFLNDVSINPWLVSSALSSKSRCGERMLVSIATSTFWGCEIVSDFPDWNLSTTNLLFSWKVFILMERVFWICTQSKSDAGTPVICRQNSPWSACQIWSCRLWLLDFCVFGLNSPLTSPLTNIPRSELIGYDCCWNCRSIAGGTCSWPRSPDDSNTFPPFFWEPMKR